MNVYSELRTAKTKSEEKSQYYKKAEKASRETVSKLKDSELGAHASSGKVAAEGDDHLYMTN